MKKKGIILKRNERKALLKLKKILSIKFDLLDFRIFGSKVRKESIRESDIDVMIVLGELNPSIESQIDDIIFEINLENDCLISAIIFNKKELEEGPMEESPIYKAINREGVRL